jgi:hypothetical protein
VLRDVSVSSEYNHKDLKLNILYIKAVDLQQFKLRRLQSYSYKYGPDACPIRWAVDFQRLLLKTPIF